MNGSLSCFIWPLILHWQYIVGLFSCAPHPLTPNVLFLVVVWGLP